MTNLILIDATTKRELGRETIHPQARYHYYTLYHTKASLSFQGKNFQIVSVAWRLPEQDLVAVVRFESWIYVDCEC
jgi:hypothetical protein